MKAKPGDEVLVHGIVKSIELTLGLRGIFCLIILVAPHPLKIKTSKQRTNK